MGAARQSQRGDIAAIGYIGSYARDDWSPGSDLDLIVVVKGELAGIGERASGWDTSPIPVPVDLMLYSVSEWRALLARSRRFREMQAGEAVWLVGEPPND